VSRSISRNFASPRVANSSGTAPCLRAMTRSLSKNGNPKSFAVERPMLLLPAAMGPTNTRVASPIRTRRSRAQCLRNRGKVGVHVPACFGNVVTTELLEHDFRKYERYYCLGHDTRRWNRANI